MKYINLVIMLFGFNLAIGQSIESEPSVSISNDQIKIENVDELGGHVIVIYNRDREKIYQSRSDERETIYAYYDQGKVVKSGVISCNDYYKSALSDEQ